MKLFSKEKDIVLKVVNSILIVGAIISIIIMISTGVNLINGPQILSYEEYAKEVCTIDKLESFNGFSVELTEEEFIKILDPKKLDAEKSMQDATIYCTELNKQRKENDNISVVLIKID